MLRKLFSYFRNLFSRGPKLKNIDLDQFSKYYDVFGDPIMFSDIVIPVKYNKLKKRGYLTIETNSETSYIPSNLVKSDDMKMGVVKVSDIEESLKNPNKDRLKFTCKEVERNNKSFIHIIPMSIYSVLPWYIK